ncbi:hypothetical protein CA13_18460 [Planctomycetes bacterium CA13]|uniref:Uncharacterized protein n=1 Tax=Novipirellula herctigrandis TaxID=2527986 RepID=A0A5C5YZA6_9BACT|nr:hypothetical protein CA13_18460 [Planctomycetes bacterium CA13]
MVLGLGQRSRQSIGAEISAEFLSKREIQACESRVGVQDGRQFGHLEKCRGWSNLRKLRSAKLSFLKGTFSPMGSLIYRLDELLQRASKPLVSTQVPNWLKSLPTEKVKLKVVNCKIASVSQLIHFLKVSLGCHD